MEEDRDQSSDRLLTLKQAVDLPCLGGNFTVKMLRTPIEKGLLRAERHGRSIFVTEAAIADWRSAAVVVPKTVPPPAAGKNRSAPVPEISDPKRHPSYLAALDAVRMLRELPEKGILSSRRKQGGPAG